MTEVAVVIPFYNPGSYIVDAVASVFAQTYSDWKLFLIDDASTDDSAALLDEYLKDPRVTLIRHKENRGQSASLNTGLEAAAAAPFFIQLDADDWFFPYTLEVLVRTAAMIPDEEIAVFSGNINVVFENKTAAGNRLLRLRRTKRMQVVKGRPFQDRNDFLLANQSIWPRFYRTSALQRIGGWSTDVPYQGRYAEDLNVLFRLLEHYRFHWVDELLLNHRRHQQNQTNQTGLYRNMTEWAIHDALKRWGDEFEPVFVTTENGWSIVSHLKRKQ